jgi:hypothetical protein
MNTSCILVTLLVGMSIGTQALAQEPASKAGEPPAAASHHDVLDRLLEGLRDGNREGVLTLFEYFEPLVGARDAAADRQVVAFFLRLIEEEFGRPDAFARLAAPSIRYVSADIESAADEQWKASPCLFKSYAVGTGLAHSGVTRAVELAVTICTGPQVERAALRRLEFRFVSPTPETVAKVRSVLERATVEARRLITPKQ